MARMGDRGVHTGIWSGDLSEREEFGGGNLKIGDH
jgi:hypothetical protein